MKFVGLKRNLIFLAGVLLAASFLSGCGDWVARFSNGKTIDENTFNQRLAELETRYAGQAPTESDGERYDQFRGTVAEDLVVRELVREEAEKRGITVTDEEAEQGLQEVITGKFGGDHQKFMEALDKEGISMDRAKEQLADGILISRLKNSVTDEVPPPSDEDAKLAYEKNPKKYELAPAVKLRHILLGSEDEAKVALERLNQGADMAALAGELSKDEANKDKGGELGWAPKGSMDQNLERVVFSLPPGAYSAATESKQGWHIFRVEETKVARQQTLEEVKETVKKELLENARDAFWSDWLQEIKQNANIEYRDGYKPAEG